ncbi:conserved hypothetical protein [Streptomyces sp. SPB78]|uniref:hypothetical protein n=1 Tax=Streptomyces sp. (strain SPB78) TaxID=591157 RepID=UPI0001B5784C|nr:hypothetical protein [Streptomyces sp. SPB78]EFK97945.1 conserved hypothetical protein [Streptomyces sp. SPB78]
MAVHPKTTETNVRLPSCAFEALTAVMARHGTSRDATVRRLLAEHVERQEQTGPDDRLTHVSTVLRYPPPPRWRKDPRQDRPLRIRVSADLLERARAVSLVLPGQYQRAFRDYQSRALTDAVMTAIASAQRFTDEFLDELLPLLHHRAARNLWKLAAAALCTGPEREKLNAAAQVREATAWTSEAVLDTDAQHLLDVVTALEEDVAWHSPARFQVAANLARDLLTGSQATDNEQLLQEEDTAWDLLYQDTLHADAERLAYLRRGTTEYDWSGRGGTAVWRAERQVGLHNFEDWLTGRTQPHTFECRVCPPGWVLTRPPGWHALALAPTPTGWLPQPYATWVDEGRALAFPHRNKQAVWPLQRRPNRPDFEPVPGAEALLTAATGLKPEQIPNYIEALLVDWNHQFDDAEADAERDLYLALDVPAGKAYEFGLISDEERQRTMAEARAATLKSMDEVIDLLSRDGCDEEDLQYVRHVRGDVRQFKKVATRINPWAGAQFQVYKATWRWPGLSVAGEFLAGTPTDLVQWLAAVAHARSSLITQQSMQQAWAYAFDRYAPRARRPPRGM